jgi:hypothetical protein
MVGEGLEPEDLGRSAVAELRGEGAAAALATLRVEADAGRDAPQPRPQPGLSAIAGTRAPCLRQGLLDEVLRIVHRSGESVAVKEQVATQRLGERPERRPVEHRSVAVPGHAHSLAPRCRQ